MKKYYALFVYNEKEYVVRFKIDGSLKYDKKTKCFIDDRYYVRSIADVIAMAALDSHPMNDKHFGFSCLLSHDYFVEYRARGIERWTPKREVIEWR